MTKSFKFNVGDLLKLNGSLVSICPPDDPSRQYKDNLRVVFRFWDGCGNVYVVDTGDGICLVLAEGDAKLQEAAGEDVGENAPVDGRDKHLYRVENKIGEFYIVARSFDEAADGLKERLREADCGFFQDRTVPSISDMAVEHFFNGRQLFCEEAGLIVMEG